MAFPNTGQDGFHFCCLLAVGPCPACPSEEPGCKCKEESAEGSHIAGQAEF